MAYPSGDLFKVTQRRWWSAADPEAPEPGQFPCTRNSYSPSCLQMEALLSLCLPPLLHPSFPPSVFSPHPFPTPPSPGPKEQPSACPAFVRSMSGEYSQGDELCVEVNRCTMGWGGPYLTMNPTSLQMLKSRTWELAPTMPRAGTLSSRRGKKEGQGPCSKAACPPSTISSIHPFPSLLPPTPSLQHPSAPGLGAGTSGAPPWLTPFLHAVRGSLTLTMPQPISCPCLTPRAHKTSPSPPPNWDVDSAPSDLTYPTTPQPPYLCLRLAVPAWPWAHSFTLELGHLLGPPLTHQVMRKPPKPLCLCLLIYKLGGQKHSPHI